ncbi:hypothetical protein J2I47_17435 [Fibrella sp. HMF5335]|uniref:DUF600 family protein n=1 Tax=Fibrella rubiginis TaxID=2817060 RepID=A0A939GIB4_9BACT|nr:hypothetical protein [Fibrella rubiginis]MBO0938338.1 hypothetical protein [Fibrella rubiginis]
MTQTELYDQLIAAVTDNLTSPWTICRLNGRYLDNGQDVEFDGLYLTPDGDEKPLSTDFHEDVAEAVVALYELRKMQGQPRANVLQLDLSAQGKYTVQFSWDQEMQDEEDHFNKGGTAREWQAIREAKYGAEQQD